MRPRSGFIAYLLLGQNLRDKGARLLADEIASNCKVKELLLSGNDITDEGGLAIAKALETNSNLRVLVLGENKITDTTAEAFAKVLKVNRSLKELNLSSTNLPSCRDPSGSDELFLGNQITDKGAVAFAHSCPHLEVLSLKGTNGLPCVCVCVCVP